MFKIDVWSQNKITTRNGENSCLGKRLRSSHLHKSGPRAGILWLTQLWKPPHIETSTDRLKALRDYCLNFGRPSYCSNTIFHSEVRAARDFSERVHFFRCMNCFTIWMRLLDDYIFLPRWWPWSNRLQHQSRSYLLDIPMSYTFLTASDWFTVRLGHWGTCRHCSSFQVLKLSFIEPMKWRLYQTSL